MDVTDIFDSLRTQTTWEASREFHNPALNMKSEGEGFDNNRNHSSGYE